MEHAPSFTPSFLPLFCRALSFTLCPPLISTYLVLLYAHQVPLSLLLSPINNMCRRYGYTYLLILSSHQVHLSSWSLPVALSPIFLVSTLLIHPQHTYKPQHIYTPLTHTHTPNTHISTLSTHIHPLHQRPPPIHIYTRAYAHLTRLSSLCRGVYVRAWVCGCAWDVSHIYICI